MKDQSDRYDRLRGNAVFDENEYEEEDKTQRQRYVDEWMVPGSR
jgi:hypothetical protein